MPDNSPADTYSSLQLNVRHVFFWISEKMPDNGRLFKFIFSGTFFWDCQAIVLGVSGNFFLDLIFFGALNPFYIAIYILTKPIVSLYFMNKNTAFRRGIYIKSTIHLKLRPWLCYCRKMHNIFAHQRLEGIF